jgi:hypothetical protein
VSGVVDDVGPGTGPAGDAVTRVAAVRAFLRQRQHAPSLRETAGKVAYQAYVVALIGGLYGTVVVRTLRTPPTTARPPLAPSALGAVPAVVVALALLATFAGVRIGTWAGPVLVSRAEAAWLLPAPLDRRRLLRRDLAWGLTGYGVAGALVGALVGTVVVVETRASVAGALLGSIVAWGALGLVTGAVALAAESSRRLARAALRGTAVVAVLGVGVVWLTAATPAVASWVTPWGWAATPVVVAAGVDVPFAWGPLALLVLAAAGSVVAALRHLPAIPDEELVRRAGAAQGVRASAAIFDARAIAQARRSGQRSLVGHRSVRIRRPRHRWQLSPWRDLVSLLRRPGALERTLVAVAAAVALVWWARGGAAAVVAAVLLVSTAAGQLLEPLRIELEEPVIGDLTPLVPADVAIEHLAVPTAVLALCGTVVALVAAAATLLPWSAVPAAVVGSVGAGALFATAAALTSTRGAPPLQWLTTGDYGALLLVGWLVAGPVLALALAVPSVLVVVASLHDGAAPLDAVDRPVTAALALSLVLAMATRWRARKRTEAE